MSTNPFIAAILLAGIAAMPAAAPAAAQDTARQQEQAVEEEAPVVDFSDPSRFQQRGGEAIYRSVCQSCHMPDGKGAVGAGMYPALAGNPNLEAAGYPVHVVLHGQKAMPAFGSYLDDEQVAEVVNFIRSSWGNEFPGGASAEDVGTAR